MRLKLSMMLVSGVLAWPGGLSAVDWENPPLYIASESVELIVGQELTVVSGRFVYQYVKADDTEHLPQVYFHYPVYVKSDVTDGRAIEEAAGFVLLIGDQPLRPVSGSIVRADALSNYPVPEDAAVGFLTFAVPRVLAEQGFEATVRYVQPNFRYRGGRMALHTPWLPRSMRQHPFLNLPDNVYGLRVTAGKDVALQRIPTDAPVLGESAAEITAVPEHRKTVAVTLH